jgi:hypothetical protein
MFIGVTQGHKIRKMANGAVWVIVLFALIGGVGCGTADNVQVFVQVSTNAPAIALQDSRIPTNNWVAEVSMSDEQRRIRSKELDQLIRKANKTRFRGEHVEKVVLSGEDFAWVTYLRDEQHSPRIIGLRKENDTWEWLYSIRAIFDPKATGRVCGRRGSRRRAFW